MDEEWKWIKGYEGRFQISSFGRLKSFLKYETGYILSDKNEKGWYLTHRLSDEKGIYHTKRTHVLVAETFIGEIPKGYHVHHKDGNKQNNMVSNLEIIHPKVHRKKTEKEHPQIVTGMVNYNKFQHPRHIRQFDMEGHFIAEFANSKIAEEMTGICQRNILQVASKTPFNNKGNIRKQAGGYVWEFTDESEVV